MDTNDSTENKPGVRVRDVLSLQLLEKLFSTQVHAIRSIAGQVLGYRLDLPLHDVQLPRFTRSRNQKKRTQMHHQKKLVAGGCHRQNKYSDVRKHLKAMELDND